MSSVKKGRPSMEGSPDALTAQLKGVLRQYVGITNAVNSTVKDVNNMQSELDDGKPYNLAKQRLERQYAELETQTDEEVKKIDEAVQIIERLLTLQAAAPPEAAGVLGATPSSAPAPMKRGPYKKRKTGDGVSSSAPSPLPSSAPSPIPYPGSNQGSPSTTTIPLPRLGSKGPQAPPVLDMPSPAASTPNSTTGPPRKLTTQQMKKAALEGQLPLRIDRIIAFKKPKTGSKEDEWILAKIVKCIQGDKNRYAVEDVDPDPSATEDAKDKTFNTTLKSILPLPDREDRARTYPAVPYPPGTRVLAVYPDTTSLYHAFIQSGPESVNKKAGSEKTYKVTFDDDDGLIRAVPVELIVEAP